MYVAVKGGEKAIDAAHALQESRRRGDTDLPELSVAQIEQQLNLAVDRVMTEGGIADRELAALALKQASGDNVEAIFLLRAYRTTLAKLAVSEPLDTTGMRLERRISAVYKDIPGGQLLGPTYDYTHRLLDFTLLANGEAPTLTTADSEQQPSPHVFSLLARQGLAKFEEDSGAQPDDITRTPPVYPCSRSSRLQQLMRGGSHSGNVAASELAQLGLLDILSSDYYPASLLDAAFRVADDESNRFTLPQAVKLVTKNPAQALNLQDRGVIGEGKRADLVLAHRKDNHIHIDHVWRQGKRVF
ncbi:amidohydrolase family protein [Escherichia coli]|uniref:carbon-phosphorus lyase complex subunit PhnI n=1 Tax=Escherichia coli TaxID=562 RepID=UPI0002514535|nr:carbon-phosphorus lyase complex subunit PhnI [Escherichia coli]EFF2119743.1 amidohydrolase family protein [Escherichia coli]EFF2134399.1 amidohydrolase family protein [Escherichia coli]EFF2153751.1 amidohydrolase family protein [Escherichia coli]EFF2158358.1 amidohydrolase family protein [Escherichia coli]EFF2172442.1 amidohydrolase family protein [Escherichia coli]